MGELSTSHFNMQKSDITQLEDIQVLVHDFYAKARIHPLLGPIFNGVIKDQWPVHLEKMVRFWQTVLLSEHTYSGAPFPVHINMPLTAVHFEQWIALFVATVHENFDGEKAEEAIDRAQKMAAMFSYKLAAIAKQRQQQAHENN